MLLLGDEVGGDALDLVRGAAVEGGLGDGVGHVGEMASHRPRPPSGTNSRLARAQSMHSWPHGVPEASFMPVDVGVDLLALDARQVVAHGHVEHEAVGVAQPSSLASSLQANQALTYSSKAWGTYSSVDHSQL